MPDPAGGLPWGMRVVHTTRGQVCVQIGRVQGGVLGELGIDGAFRDDGRFHPLPADVLPADATSGQSQNASCHLAGQTFTGDVAGLDRNATASENTPSSPRQDLRDISYGVLGPHAVSVTYRTDGTQPSEPVLAETGAYLIVQRASTHERVAFNEGSNGTDQLNTPRPSPVGAVTAITYRFAGKVCEESIRLKVDHPCPRPQVTPGEFRPAPPRDLHRPVHVRLQLRGRLIVSAELRFTAPFAVTSAREDYSISMPSPWHAGTTVSSVDRDVARGSTVRVTLPYPFANACGPTVPVQVLYSTNLGFGRGAGAPILIIGSATLRIPSGTRPAPPPVGVPHHHAQGSARR